MCDGNSSEQVVKHAQEQQMQAPQTEQQLQPQWERYQAPEHEDKFEKQKRLRGFRRKISQEELEQLRRKSQYTFPQATDVGGIHQVKAGAPHVVKKLNQAITDVLGEQIYEHIDAIKMSEEEQDRTVRLHHARGTQLADSGRQVFKYRFAGTGYRQWREDQNGLRGKARLMAPEDYEKKSRQISEKMMRLADTMDSSDMATWSEKQRTEYQELRRQLEKLYEQLEAQDEYGEMVQLGNKTRKYVLKKTSQDGKKVAYSIAGALMKIGGNYGDYSIESNVESFLQLAQGDLEPIFRKWDEDGQAGEDISMLIRGHSRGGVASLIGPMKLQKWLNDNWPQYADKVKFEITQNDPVAGITSNWKEKGQVDIQGDEKELAKRGMAPLKNAETTVIYSLHTEHPVFFRPQDVRGAKRVILAPFKHSVGMEQLDESQVRVRRDQNGNEVERREKAHRTGYTDLKTGEVYRQTGLNELDTGFYILDQGNHLVKIDSYEQAEKIIDLAVKGKHSQWRRHSHIKDVAKAWFHENRSVDEIQRQAQDEQSRSEQFLEQVLASEKKSVFLDSRDSRQMTDVKAAVNELVDALAQPLERDAASQQCRAIYDCYQKLIRMCETYTGRHTPFTSVGRARKRMVEQLQKRAETEQKYFADYDNRIRPLLEMHEGEAVSWDRILADARSVRMNKLSGQEGAVLAQLRNGASATLTRGDKTYDFTRENDLLAQSSTVRKNVAARDLSELLGVSGLYEQARFAEAHVEVNGRIPAHTVRGVLTRASEGKPLVQIRQRAEKEHAHLQYSPEALRQIQMIRVMDVLMGYTTRAQDDFLVKVARGQSSADGKNWIITQVSSKEHARAFEEKGLDEQMQGNVTLERLFGSTRLAPDQNALLEQLNTLSDELIDFRLGHALTHRELAGLKTRIHEVQRLYRLQKQNNFS